MSKKRKNDRKLFIEGRDFNGECWIMVTPYTRTIKVQRGNKLFTISFSEIQKLSI